MGKTLLVEKIKKGLKSEDIRGMSGWKGQLVRTRVGKPLGFYAKNMSSGNKEELYMVCNKINITDTFIEGSNCKIKSCSPQADAKDPSCKIDDSRGYVKLNMEIGEPRDIADFSPNDEPIARSFYLSQSI